MPATAAQESEAIPYSTSLGRAPETIYWLLPIALAAVQYVVTRASMHRIRYEELAEAVRNVFWLQHHLLFDGISSNVGWYGTLLLIYKAFGFTLFSGKFVRLALHLIGLFCTAILLRRGLGAKRAMLPLILIGLSPTVLFFTTFQTSFGIDLPSAAICLLLLFSTRFQSVTIVDLTKTFLVGAVAMIAALSYPTFLCYLPSLLLLAVARFRKSNPPLALPHIALHFIAATIGFVLPLAAILTFLQNPSQLIYDPITNAGIFRGGGIIGFNPTALRDSVVLVLKDLAVKGESYYFEVTRPEFSGPLAGIGLAFIIGAAIYLCWMKRIDRAIFFAALLLLAVSFVVPNLSVAGGQAGLRRCTGILAAYFVLFALVWDFCTKNEFLNVWSQRIAILVCLLLPLNNLLAFPALLPVVRTRTDYEVTFFETKSTPTESLQFLIAGTANGDVLNCYGDDATPCRYQETYAAIAGYRLWNGMDKIDIKGLDWNTGQEIVLTPSLWSEYHFPH